MIRPKMVAEAARLGAVEMYMLARVAPEPGRMITCADAFSDYRAWCAREGLAPLRESAFTSTFEDMARAAGIPLRQRGGNLSFLDTTLKDLGAVAPH